VNSKTKITPASILILVIVVGVFLYQYSQGGLNLESSPSKPPAQNSELDVPTSGQPGQFDFYVLALSWSPDYCATDGADDAQQCSIGRRLGFVLHGLWPQYNRGYPSNCATSKMPADVKAKFSALYPNTKLYDHEWEKHGTCTGLTPEQYLAMSKHLKDSVIIPDSYRAPEQPFRVTATRLKQDFSAVNSALGESALATYCSGSGRFLQELFVCFSHDGKPLACSSEIQSRASRSCGNSDFLVRNVR
jgi:ribonuclease T2